MYYLRAVRFYGRLGDNADLYDTIAYRRRTYPGWVSDSYEDKLQCQLVDFDGAIDAVHKPVRGDKPNGP